MNIWPLANSGYFDVLLNIKRTVENNKGDNVQKYEVIKTESYIKSILNGARFAYTITSEIEPAH